MPVGREFGQAAKARLTLAQRSLRRFALCDLAQRSPAGAHQSHQCRQQDGAITLAPLTPGCQHFGQ
jgi:hypothetical protein